MTRIEKVFEQKQHAILNMYCTAGFPNIDSTLKVIAALEQHGADIVELGMPYSDPLADGPVIQESSSMAIANGMSMELLFQQLAALRPQHQIPVILMGYMNPVLQYGFEQFCEKAAAVGVDGLILPDLPIFEFESIYGEIVRRNGLNFIFLVTPETSEERIRKIDELSSGFIYAVSSSSTTGGQIDQSAVAGYLQRLQSMQLRNPVLVGFGIRDKASFDAACAHANGAIVGTAFIQHLAKATDEAVAAKEMVEKIK
jgi:tryptophan synthase alpha chain